MLRHIITGFFHTLFVFNKFKIDGADIQVDGKAFFFVLPTKYIHVPFGWCVMCIIFI